MQLLLKQEVSMEDQVTIRLPRELSKALKEKAARMQRKPSEVVRMAVAEFLQIPEQPEERPAERVRDLIGSLESGVPDLAIRHREYLLKKLRRGR
jgi:Arc/MetJ-type ribon-helix-helix transcriptional regulator